MKLLPSIITLTLLFFSPLAAKFNPQKILSQMTVPEKAAELMIVAAVSNEEKNKELMEHWHEWASYRLDQKYIENLITQDKIGGIIFYGNNTDAAEQAALSKHYQSLSKRPLLITLDIENSLTNRLHKKSVTQYPCAMTLGAINDPQLIYQLGYELGRQLRKIGVHWTFSPVADVNCNALNPIINYRSFGSDQERVTRHSVALMQGLQDAGVLACAKHFPGHGDTIADSHEKLPLIAHDIERLKKVELYPYSPLIEAGVRSIMMAHLEVTALENEKGKPSSLSHAIVTKLLKKKMGFKGIVVTDALGMKGATVYAKPGEEEVQALEAGNDVLLCPVDPKAAIAAIVEAVKNGRISEKELDKKVLKVLNAKKWAFKHEDTQNATIASILQSEKARALKKLLYSKAITIAQASSPNPFAQKTSNKAVLALRNEKTPFEKTIAQHNIIQYALPKTATDDEIATAINTLKNHDHVMISVHGMSWNREENYNIPEQTFALIKKLKGLGKQVSVILFGSPYSIPQFKEADNIIVAYENDEDAQTAAAEVICGVREAEGTLPIDPYVNQISQAA